MREKGQTEVAKTLETPVFSRGIEILTEKVVFYFIYQTIYIHLDKATLMSHNVFRNIRVAKKEQRT